MIRHSSIFGRLLANVWGREAATVCGFLPHHLHPCQFGLGHLTTRSTSFSRMFSISEKSKEDRTALLKKSRSVVETKIWALQSVEDVLDAASSEFSVNSLGLFLKRLAELHLQDSKVYNLENDERFISIGSALAERVSNLSSFELVESLQCLLQLTKEDSDVIKKLEEQTKAKLLRFSFPQLLRIVEMHKSCYNTNLRQLMLKDAMIILERRWVEIKNAKELISVFYLASSEEEKLLLKLEEKALELSESMNAKDLYRFLYLMAKKNRRNVPVIRSLIYHINKFSLSLSSVQLANLSYACAKLNIYDSKLMNKIAEEMLQSVQKEASAVKSLSSVLHSFGLLRWRATNLMDGAVEKFLTHGASLPVDCWVNLLTTAGCVNYLPPSLEKSLPDIIARLGKLRESDPRLWLNVVWSTAALSVATSSSLSSVLSDDFLLAIEETLVSQNPVPAYLKLLQINALAKYCLPGYDGNLLQDSTVGRILKEVPTRQQSALSDCLLDTLSNMGNLGKYSATNVRTTAGFSIDAVLVINSSAELQPTATVKEFSFSVVDLPQGLHKIAVQLLEFGDMTHGTNNQPSGRSALEAKLISKAGYKVVQIPFSDFNMKMTVVQRVQYLSAKLKEVLGRSEQPNQNVSSQQEEVKLKKSPTQRKKTPATAIPDSSAVPSQSKDHKSGKSLDTETPISSEHLVKISVKDLLDDSETQVEPKDDVAQKK